MIKKIPCLTVAIFFLAGVFSPALAADNSTLIDLVQKRYDRLKTFEADFEQTLTHRESGSTEKRSGRLLFQKPLRIRWETSKPHEETLIVNDREIWDYLPDENLAYRYSPDLARDSGSIIQVLTGQAALTRDFEAKGAGNEDGLSKLILYPREPTTQMVEGAIWVEPETGQIRRALALDFYGNANDIRFKTFRPDAKIASGQFAFAPPKGVEVEDRIDRKVEERDLFK